MEDRNSELLKLRELISNLGKPKDDLERSYFHFICRSQSKETNRFSRIKSQFFSFVITPALFLLYFTAMLFPQKKTKYDAVLYCSNKRHEANFDVMPQELVKKYQKTVVISNLGGKNHLRERVMSGRLSMSVLRCWIQLVIRYPFEFYMNCYILSHLARLECWISKYSPDAIISVLTEQDFATSILTLYCEKKGIKYIGFQHGDYMLSLERAFVRFTRYYAWNQETIDIFTATGSEPSFFRLYDSQRFHERFKRNEAPKYDIAYYLSDEKEDAIIELKERMVRLCQNHMRCKIRPHPRSTDMNVVHLVYEGTEIDIEDPSTTSLKDSLEDSVYIVSLNSTVLSEAYYGGLDVYIDDMSPFLTIDEMKERKCVNAFRINKRLSHLMNNISG